MTKLIAAFRSFMKAPNKSFARDGAVVPDLLEYFLLITGTAYPNYGGPYSRSV
jgi:hypothetical protein